MDADATFRGTRDEEPRGPRREPAAVRHRAWARLAFVLGVAALALTVTETAAAAAGWTCWLQRGEQLACLSTSDAVDGPGANAQRSTPRELMQLIRARPGALRGQMVYIPLHTAAFDDSPLALLANAVLCGPRPRDGCSVSFERDASRMGLAARQALVDATDPVLGRP